MSTASAHHACPQCGSLEITISAGIALTPDADDTKRATCAICTWEGPARETIGFATTDIVWDFNRIAELTLRVVVKHAAGPLMQLWDFIGLVPKMKEVDRTVTGPRRRAHEAHNAKVQEIRDTVMRAVLEGAITAAFNAAAEMPAKYPELYKTEETNTATTPAEQAEN